MANEELQEITEIRAQIFFELAKMVELAFSLNEYMDKHGEYLKAVENRMDKYLDQSKAFAGMMDAMLAMLGKVGAALNDHTDRTNKLISKVESYFGDGTGLEREN